MFKKLWRSLFKDPNTHEVGFVRIIRIRENGAVLKVAGTGSSKDFKEGDTLIMDHRNGNRYAYKLFLWRQYEENKWDAVVVALDYKVK